jgi:lysophospholipid acyltransferase (LPLAT)-like uncharacterized protein
MARIGKRLVTRVGPLLAAWIIRLLHATMRIDYVNRSAADCYWQRGKPVILAFWHDQLLMMIKGYYGPEARVLISPSGDGELIARTMACFGQGAVRGSSSRGGAAALREMVKLAREPYDLVVTPDGPKGPRHEVKMGVVQLAKLTRRPVLPMAFVASKGHRFNSWDRFLLPFPFARGVYAFGDVLTFGEHETLDEFAVRLETAMKVNTAQAIAYLEDQGVSAV